MKIQFYAIPEVGRRLSVTRQTVYRYIKLGIITPIRLPDGRMRISEQELKDFSKHLLNCAKTPLDDLDKATVDIEYYNRTGHFPS